MEGGSVIKLAMSGKAFEACPFEDMVDVISRIGYEGLEIRTCETQLPVSISNEEAARKAAILAEHNLTTTCLSTFTGDYSELTEPECEAQFEEFVRFVELSEILDCRQIRHWAGWRASKEATAEQWARSLRWMGVAADYAAEHDRDVALELHHRSLLDNVDSILRYVEGLNRPNVVLLYDAENMYHDQVSYGREAVERLAPYIGGVHIKDTVLLADDSNPHGYMYAGRHFWRKLINEGGVDHYSVLTGLKNAGYEGFLTVETSGVIPDPVEIAQHDYDEVSKMVQHVWGKGVA
jgi:sugar phosphate isomerase/epimerase